MTNEVGIIIFVTKKQDEDKLRSLQVEPVPKEIEGVATGVQEISIYPRLADDARYDPIKGGIATIRSPSPYVGTLGIIIRMGKKLYAITNNHVGANKDVLGMKPPAGDPWVQPSCGSVPADLIARLYKWNRLKPQSPGNINHYDVAIVEIVQRGLSRQVNDGEIQDIGQIKTLKTLI